MTLIELNQFLEEERRNLHLDAQAAPHSSGQPGVRLVGKSRAKEALAKILAVPELLAMRETAVALATNPIFDESGDPIIPQQTFSILNAQVQVLEQRLGDLHAVLATIVREETPQSLTIRLPANVETLTKLSDLVKKVNDCLGHPIRLLVPEDNSDPHFQGFDVGSNLIVVSYVVKKAYDVARIIVRDAMRLWSFKIRIRREEEFNKQLALQVEDYENIVNNNRKIRDAIADTMVKNIEGLSPNSSLDPEGRVRVRSAITTLAELFDTGLRIREPLKLPDGGRVIPAEQDALSGKLAETPLLEASNKSGEPESESGGVSS